VFEIVRKFRTQNSKSNQSNSNKNLQKKKIKNNKRIINPNKFKQTMHKLPINYEFSFRKKKIRSEILISYLCQKANLLIITEMHFEQ
jgi:hypothetical protein